jgi:hypothetical protein
LFLHVTVVPTAIVTDDGPNRKSSMSTVRLAAGGDGAGGAAPVGAVVGELLSLHPSARAKHAMTADAAGNE